ncbi:hypothetical protein [Streptomyces sp. VNUA24]|uniref:hypothetical protein n=1 Tax=Streptomyces sp. VNUA24 TaxID=3031131 RepID=UPI0023B78208|nr:hypothetical protein [Streptomyces sp. VNUA24]WEH17173.1 hypothetical protein PYR72_27140 [Streptomyces sp. VNUA24]
MTASPRSSSRSLSRALCRKLLNSAALGYLALVIGAAYRWAVERPMRSVHLGNA